MSGHSKWNNIAKRKGANDAKKAAIFTKIGRKMAVAIKEGGSNNPDNNAKLRDCIAEAKANNVPNDNIKRMLDKGNQSNVSYESNTYEGYGPSGIAVICETLTDNRNRTVADVRHYFDKFGGNLGTSGCVSFMFSEKGVLVLENNGLDEDQVMEDCFDAGADDFDMGDDVVEVTCSPDSFSDVRQKLEEKGYTFISAEVEMVPSTTTPITDPDAQAQMAKLLDALDDDDDVQNVWHNLENEEDLDR